MRYNHPSDRDTTTIHHPSSTSFFPARREAHFVRRPPTVQLTPEEGAAYAPAVPDNQPEEYLPSPGASAPEQPGLISRNVGENSPNLHADVVAVVRILFDLQVISVAEFVTLSTLPNEPLLGECIRRYQRRIFNTYEDGIVEVGGKTEENLINRNPGVIPDDEKEVTPPESLSDIFAQYQRGEIDMIALAVKVKAFITTDPAGVLAIFDQLPWKHRDNLAYAICTHSTDEELAGYDRTVLEKMSGLLSPEENWWNVEAKKQQKARIDKILGKTGDDFTEYYLVYDPKGQAYLRDENGELLEGKPYIEKWTKVRLDQTKKISDKLTIALVKSEDGAKTLGWTNRTNLYEQFWNPADHKAEYEAVGKGYAEAMLRIDPTKTIQDLRKSGTGVKAIIDKYYPNSTDINDLSSEFKPDLQDFMTYLRSIDITVSITAGLRHPLRSLVFDCAINAAAGNKDRLMLAQAMSTKYGIPIDWLHYNDQGDLDLATSYTKAKEVKNEFGLGSTAARGVKDFGGKVSNHNRGDGADLAMSFGFTEKTVEKGGKSYTINASSETPVKQANGSYYLANCGSKPLAQLGKDNFDVTRILDNDAIHWSKTGR